MISVVVVAKAYGCGSGYQTLQSDQIVPGCPWDALAMRASDVIVGHGDPKQIWRRLERAQDSLQRLKAGGKGQTG